jgi:hypothetical protein
MAEPARKAPSRFGFLVPLATALLLMVILPFGFLAFVFWAADGSWDFEGRDGVRYWVFVKGSRLERFGLIEPTNEPGKYSVSLQDGTFPGWSVLTYRSTAMPEAVIAAYAQRCREMGLKITREAHSKPDDGTAGGVALVCEIKPYIDAEFQAQRKPGEVSTEVGLRVWRDD